MRIALDKFDLFYYIEGLARYDYSDISVWEWALSILNKLDLDTKECIRHWCERDLGEEFSDDASFQSFLSTYDLPFAEGDMPLLVDMGVGELKCFIASKGHGSHLRQDIWEFMVDSCRMIPKGVQKELYEWAKEEFTEDSDDKENFLDCYNPDNRYVITIEYSHGKKEVSGHECYLHKGEYHVGFHTILREWEERGESVRIVSVEKK